MPIKLLITLLVLGIVSAGTLLANFMTPVRATAALAAGLITIFLIVLISFSATFLIVPFLIPFVIAAGAIGIISGTLLKKGDKGLVALIYFALIFMILSYWLSVSN